MIAQLRTQSCSGDIHDLAHVSTEDCLSDCLTKKSAKPDNLIKAVNTGVLPNIDKHPPFRSMIEHKAFCTSLDDWSYLWIIPVSEPDSCFLNIPWEQWTEGSESLKEHSQYDVLFMNWRLPSADHTRAITSHKHPAVS